MAMANRIREAREQHMALTQRELGNEIGTDAMTVSRWERGVTEPRPSHLRKLSSLSGLPVAWFFSGDGASEQDGAQQ